jgi:hypothetical protein
MASGALIRSTATGVVWFLCGLCLSCGQPERNVDENHRLPDPDQDPKFFSELVHIPPGGDSVFLSYLRACRAPEWEDMLGEEAIQEVTLYELEQAEESLEEAESWDFLIVIRAAPGTSSKRVFGPSHGPGACPDFPNPSHTILRTETLAPTPNSYYPEPNPVQEGREAEIQYLVEFIGVQDTPEALQTYRNLMTTYFGPENGVLVEEGKLHSLIALETTEVLFQAPGVSPWNQLHISGAFPEYLDLDWDSAYADLHQRLFSADLDSTWSQMPPIRDRPGDYHARLLERFRLH